MPPVNFLDELDCRRSLAHLIHVSLHLQVGLLAQELQVLLLEVARIYVYLDLALRDLDVHLSISVHQQEAIALGHGTPVGVFDGSHQVLLLQLLVEFESLLLV
mmetsp:Transcript_24066/g.32275  ORF Transcript_24066/g.32275 Transcript_24066/m.32275 type:complete len:103 (+) Transcript_24066:208-516(+)